MDGLLPKQGLRLSVIQVAWVVNDRQRAMEHWLSLGVGPFFTLDVNMPSIQHRGQPSSISMLIGLAQAGSVQIELIQQTGPEPSAYTEVASSEAAQFHHICQALGYYDETIETLRQQGVVVVTEGRFGDGGPRFCYADTRETLGCFLELADDSEVGQKLYKITRDAAQDWDGQEPIRRIEPLLA